MIEVDICLWIADTSRLNISHFSRAWQANYRRNSVSKFGDRRILKFKNCELLDQHDQAFDVN